MKRFREKKLSYVVILVLGMLTFFRFASGGKSSKGYKEYDVKATFLINFLLFCDFPKNTFSGPDDPMVIGIIGRDPYGDILDKLAAEKGTVYNHKLVIKRFKKSVPIADLRKCHLLYVSPVIFRSKIKKILDSLKNFPVLTVSEVKVFVHLGGMINFVIVEEEVKFEINKAAADYTGIKIHSSVLSLAIRVIGADHEK